MRIEYVYTCCRCGKEFKGTKKLFGTTKVNIVKAESNFYQTKAEYDYKEICPLCFRELKLWLKGNSLSIDEVKRLHDDIDELNRQIDMSKEMVINRDKEILKLRGEIALLDDKCSWFLEEVDTPNGKATVSKDWKKLKEAKEIIKKFLSNNDIKNKTAIKDVEDAKRFLKDNFPEEDKDTVF